MTRRAFLAAAVSTAAAASFGIASVEGPGTYVIERFRTSSERLRSPLRVAFLCDLHHGRFVRADAVRAWVDAALAERPDLIVLGGDLVDVRAGGDPGELLDELERLEAPLGVHAVRGNHDHVRWGRRLPRFEEELRRRGIGTLTNEGIVARPDLFLAGVDDLRQGEADLEAALRDRPDDAACLLVSHNPDLLPSVPADAVDLTLCGHTHGGQIRLPVVGALKTSSRYGRRFLAGPVRAPARGYVSRGLGTTLLPIRLNCPAELTVVDLAPVR